MGTLTKGSYALDKKTGRCYLMLTDSAIDSGNRRWVETSRLNRKNGQVTGSKNAIRCQVSENQLIPISYAEGRLAMAVEQFFRNHPVKDAVWETALAVYDDVLKPRGLDPKAVQRSFYKGAC